MGLFDQLEAHLSFLPQGSGDGYGYGGGAARHLADLITAELDKAGFSRKATAPKQARRGLGSY